ncbi:MAG: hypothetical protein K0S65_3051 [Labilithrix sp.]|nr:hypothetical protein [Labilithrix sp.]
MCTTSSPCERPFPPVVRTVFGRVAPLPLVLASIAASGEARAETSTVPVHVVVDASASCTNEEKFWAEVTSRTSELRPVPTTEGGVPELAVRAWQGEGVVRGELALRTARGERLPPRSVVGRTCDEVTAALALALVLALEEGALKSEPPPRPSPEPESSPEPAPEHRSMAPSPPPAAPSPLHSDAEEPPARLAMSMGALGHLMNADGFGGGAGIYTELRLPFFERRLAFRLGGAAWWRTVSRDANEAELRWSFVRAQVCFRLAVTVALSLCGLGDGGAFSASATKARSPRSFSAPWAGAGVAVNAALNWSRRLGIAVEAGGLVPIVSDDLVLRPSVRLYSTPAVITWVGIGPVLHFD